MPTFNMRFLRGVLPALLLVSLALPVETLAEAGVTNVECFINSGACEVETISVQVPNPNTPGETMTETRISCKDVSCDGICVLYKVKGDQEGLQTRCYCDWPNVNGEGPELES